MKVFRAAICILLAVVCIMDGLIFIATRDKDYLILAVLFAILYQHAAAMEVE